MQEGDSYRCIATLRNPRFISIEIGSSVRTEEVTLKLNQGTPGDRETLMLLNHVLISGRGSDIPLKKLGLIWRHVIILKG